MRTLDELGISPAPWSYDLRHPRSVWDGYDELLIQGMDPKDARLVAAAPMLYEVAAWCKEQADEIGKCCIRGGVNPYALAQCMAGIVRRCEAAIAAASGESVTDCNQ